jgi:hypothetical protein
MSTDHSTRIPGFRLDPKTGKPIRDLKRLDVSTRLKAQARASKRVRVGKRGFDWQAPLSRPKP